MRDTLLAERLVLEGLPQGAFEVRFVSNKGYFRLPASRGGGSDMGMQLWIGEETAALDLDFARVATVELELLNSEGWPELERAGFQPMRRGSSGGWTSRGTVNTRWSSPGERPVALFAAGTYRIDPLGTVVGLDPRADVGPRGGLDPPVLLNLKAGNAIKLVWQAVGG